MVPVFFVAVRRLFKAKPARETLPRETDGAPGSRQDE